LPDGLFSNQKSRFGYILEALAKEDVDMYIICPFGLFLRLFGIIFCGHLVYFVVIGYIFPRSGMLYPEKSGSPGNNATEPGPLEATRWLY
jgi:hypothetical protein